MSERIRHYFGGQRPPPPPPPPPSNPSSTAIQEADHLSSGQPFALKYNYNYNYGRGLAVPGRPTSYNLAAGNHSIAHNESSSNVGGDSNTTNKNNNDKKKLKESQMNTTSCLRTHSASDSSDKILTAKETTATKKNVSWTCDPCQITLESEMAFKSHRKSHVKCSDCSFEGAPKFVKAHYQAKHGKFSGSGFKTITVGVPGCRVQKFKICVGNRPEDIQQWIAERKKRFPRSNSTNVPASNDRNIVGSVSEGKPKSSASTTSAKPAGETQHLTSTTTGLTSLLAGYGSSDDDDDSDSDNKDENLISTESLSNAIAPTIKCEIEEDILGSNIDRKEDVDSKTEPTGEDISTFPSPDSKNPSIKTSEIRNQGNEVQKTRPCRFFFRKGSCRHGNNCRFSHDDSRFGHHFEGDQQKEPTFRTGGQKNNNTKKRKRGGHTSSDTLLRKLLQSDMNRESALTMQLLKFIVENNFFDDGDGSRKKREK